jgi:hypothetical protein
MTVIAKAGRNVPMTGLPMSKMAAHCDTFPVSEVTAGPMVHIVVAEMLMVFAVREAMVGEVSRKVAREVAAKAAVAKTSVSAKTMRRGIDLGQGETEEDCGRDGMWFTQGHRALSEELFGAALSAFTRGISMVPLFDR